MAVTIDPEVRHIACIGLTAAGKSTVGGLVAEALGWRLVDVDAEVETRTGQTVAELAYEGGEAAFRPWEQVVVLEALADHRPSVLVAPGGIALDPEARKAVGAIDVAAVYLRADPRMLAITAATDLHHEGPIGTEDRLDALVGMFLDRDATYRALADVEVDVDGRSPEHVAAIVLAALAR